MRSTSSISYRENYPEQEIILLWATEKLQLEKQLPYNSFWQELKIIV